MYRAASVFTVHDTAGASGGNGRTPAMNGDERTSTTRWWEKHRDRVLYSIAFIGLVLFGLLWKGALSLILSPLWMLTVVWIVPSAIERLVAYRR